jgi:uncharacterized membrane protein YfcA
MELATYLISGAVAGLLAGLLGIGGGLVVVPALALLFAGHGVVDAHLMHMAVGTSLAAMIPTAIASTLAHHRRGSVHWPAVRGLLPGIVIGALCGAWLARHISSSALALCFGVFEILVALILWLGTRPVAHRALPGTAGMAVAGIGIGAISAVLGIGGATLTTPFLLWNGVDIRRAVGTSASCGLPIALAGAAGFAVTGLSIMAQRDWTTGFIYWPAVAGIALTSVTLAPMGARLAHYLPRPALQRVFALFLFMVGVKMVLERGL